MDIKESNKLIAEFMGWYQEDGDDLHWMVNDGISIKVIYSIPNNYPHRTLPFHRSWDWLMPVVEKIQSVGYNISISTNGFVKIVKVGGVGKTDTNVIPIRYFGNLKENVYNSVVEFIKWYNEKN